MNKAKLAIGNCTYISRLQKLNAYIHQRADGDGAHHIPDHDYREGSITPNVLLILKKKVRNRSISWSFDRHKEKVPAPRCDDSCINLESTNTKGRNKHSQEFVDRYLGGKAYINLYCAPPSKKKKKKGDTEAPKVEKSASKLLGKHTLDQIFWSGCLENDKIRRMIMIGDSGPDTNIQHENSILVWYAIFKALVEKYPHFNRLIVVSFAAGQSASNPVERTHGKLNKAIVGQGCNDVEAAMEEVSKLWNELENVYVKIAKDVPELKNIPTKMNLKEVEKSPYMVEFTTTGKFTRLFEPAEPLVVCGDGRKTSRASYCEICLESGKKWFNWSADASRKHKKTYHPK